MKLMPASKQRNRLLLKLMPASKRRNRLLLKLMPASRKLMPDEKPKKRREPCKQNWPACANVFPEHKLPSYHQPIIVMIH